MRPRPPSISSPRFEEADRAARLLDAARAYQPRLTVTFADIQAAVRARRALSLASGWSDRMGWSGRRLLACAIAVVLLLALGSLALSRGWLPRQERAAPTSISVPAGASVRLERRAAFRLSLRGPATIEVGAGDDGPLRLDEGELVLSTERRAVSIAVGAHRVAIPQSATASVRASRNGELQVSALAGAAPRVDGALGALGSRGAGVGSTATVAADRAAPTVPPVVSPPGDSPVAPPGGGAAEPLAATRAAATEAEAGAKSPRRATAARPPAVAAAAQAGPDETSYVRDALARLRGAGDAAGALRLLDQHDRAFPRGAFADESRSIRIEALMALGRSAEALDRLEAFPAASLTRWRRLRVLRGELRAARGRCAEALDDFAAVIQSAAGDDIERRGLRGQAACSSVMTGVPDTPGKSEGERRP